MLHFKRSLSIASSCNMSARSIAIYFTAPNYNDSPFGERGYEDSYKEFARVLTERGATVFIVRSKQTYLGQSRFSKGWVYQAGEFTEVLEPFTVDVVYNKGEDYLPDDGLLLVTGPAFDQLMQKDKTLEFCAELLPQTFVAKNRQELEEALSKIVTDRAVAKPPDGSCGRGIVIGSKEEVLAKAEAYPLIVQAFIDTSQGIPGITSTYHDLRIVFIGGQIALSYVRTPGEGSLLANVAQGGTIKLLEPHEVPDDALTLALAVDAKLQRFPERVYSVDMGRDRDGSWKLIELNNQPGLTAPEWGREVYRYYEMLAEHLMGLAHS
jgi:hypothetical protein